LLEGSRMTHADTLMVFFAAAYQQYRTAITEREKLLLGHLAVYCARPKFRSFDDVVSWWTDAFVRVGRMAFIERELRLIEDWQSLEQRIFERVDNDRVWCEKESPVPLDAAAVRHFVRNGLVRHKKEGPSAARMDRSESAGDSSS
jgi:hypothetical protein